jgi:RNA polymerase sigma-70 factor (ECF subfamily)
LNAKQLLRNQTISLQDFHFPSEKDDTQDYARKELMQILDSAMELLPDDYREAFVLREYSGCSYNEISSIIEQPLSVVKIRIFRAKKKLREILAPVVEDLKQHI